MRIAFLNDTSDWYHWGCTATSQSIIRHLSQIASDVRCLSIRRTYNLSEVPADLGDFFSGRISPAFERANPDVLEILGESDVIVANGEGTLHGVRKASFNLLYLLLMAKHTLGKRVFIINHSMYPDSQSSSVSQLRRLGERAVGSALGSVMPAVLKSLSYEFYRRAYNQLDGAAFRETTSFAIARKLKLQTRIVSSFDCLPLSVAEAVYAKATAEKGRNRRVILAARGDMPQTYLEAMSNIARELQAGGFELEVLAGARASECKDERRLHAGLQETGIASTLYDASSLDEWLTRIGSATGIISGRFHHTIAAHMVETPSVLLDAMTPKLIGISRMLDLPSPRPHTHYLDSSKAADALRDMERCPILSAQRRQEILNLATENFRLLTG